MALPLIPILLGSAVLKSVGAGFAAKNTNEQLREQNKLITKQAKRIEEEGKLNQINSNKNAYNSLIQMLSVSDIEKTLPFVSQTYNKAIDNASKTKNQAIMTAEQLRTQKNQTTNSANAWWQGFKGAVPNEGMNVLNMLALDKMIK